MIRDSLSKVTTLADKEELDMQTLTVETERIFQAKGITAKVQRQKRGWLALI